MSDFVEVPGEGWFEISDSQYMELPDPHQEAIADLHRILDDVRYQQWRRDQQMSDETHKSQSLPSGPQKRGRLDRYQDGRPRHPLNWIVRRSLGILNQIDCEADMLRQAWRATTTDRRQAHIRGRISGPIHRLEEEAAEAAEKYFRMNPPLFIGPLYVREGDPCSLCSRKASPVSRKVSERCAHLVWETDIAATLGLCSQCSWQLTDLVGFRDSLEELPDSVAARSEWMRRLSIAEETGNLIPLVIMEGFFGPYLAGDGQARESDDPSGYRRAFRMADALREELGRDWRVVSGARSRSDRLAGNAKTTDLAASNFLATRPRIGFQPMEILRSSSARVVDFGCPVGSLVEGSPGRIACGDVN
jgi:hypothetical protein